MYTLLTLLWSPEYRLENVLNGIAVRPEARVVRRLRRDRREQQRDREKDVEGGDGGGGGVDDHRGGRGGAEGVHRREEPEVLTATSAGHLKQR